MTNAVFMPMISFWLMDYKKDWLSVKNMIYDGDRLSI